MHSRCRYSSSNTFSAMTTVPSATEVTLSGEPPYLRSGTRKNAVCQAQNHSSKAIRGHTIQGMCTNSNRAQPAAMLSR